MIDDREVRQRAEAAGVPTGQIVKDHLLSHLIHGLQAITNVTFIGGTALNRTHLDDLRLSEDLDLLLLEGDPSVIVDALLRMVRLEFPTHRRLFAHEFSTKPSDNVWRTELARQVAVPGTPADSLRVVYEALSDHLGWER